MLERIEARTAQIGEGFTIRRALPNRQRRMVGAWCFLDHAGPVDYGLGQGPPRRIHAARRLLVVLRGQVAVGPVFQIVRCGADERHGALSLNRPLALRGGLE